MKIPNKTRDEIVTLYQHGMSMIDISRKLGVKYSSVQYRLGLSTIAPPRPYIKDEKKRAATIEALKNEKGKDYKTILFLNYLRGHISKAVYESAFTAIY